MTIAAPELEDGDLAVIQHAVSLAKSQQIRTAKGLRAALRREQYTEREISAAIGFWAHYEQTKPGANRYR